MTSATPRRSVSCSSLCTGLAFGLALAPSLPVLAATGSGVGFGVGSGVGTASARAVLVDATGPAPEEAATPEGDPEALSAEAVERFEAKDYDGAVALFEQAYAIDPNPNYLFNIGRVYEEKGDLQRAVEFYQRFVKQSGVDIESRQAATERLKVLREALAQIEADKADETPPPDETTEPTDEVTEPEPSPPPPDERAERTAKRKKTLRITGYSLLGVGGGALVAGAVLGGIASSTADEANGDMFVDRTIALRNRARRQAIAADAMFITGGVLAATGLALVLATLGGKKSAKAGDTASRRTRWSPVVGPERVGVGLTHRF